MSFVCAAAANSFARATASSESWPLTSIINQPLPDGNSGKPFPFQCSRATSIRRISKPSIASGLKRKRFGTSSPAEGMSG